MVEAVAVETIAGMTPEMIAATQMGLKAVGAGLAVGLTGVGCGIAEMGIGVCRRRGGGREQGYLWPCPSLHRHPRDHCHLRARRCPVALVLTGSAYGNRSRS